MLHRYTSCSNDSAFMLGGIPLASFVAPPFSSSAVAAAASSAFALSKILTSKSLLTAYHIFMPCAKYCQLLPWGGSVCNCPQQLDGGDTTYANQLPRSTLDPELISIISSLKSDVHDRVDSLSTTLCDMEPSSYRANVSVPFMCTVLLCLLMYPLTSASRESCLRIVPSDGQEVWLECSLPLKTPDSANVEALTTKGRDNAPSASQATNPSVIVLNSRNA